MLILADVDFLSNRYASESARLATRAQRNMLFRASALFALALIPSLSSAAIFKCISPDGSISYTDETCPTDTMTQYIDATARQWPSEPPQAMSTIPAIRDAKAQSQPETIAILCANDEFRVWLKAQRQSLPEREVRTAKFIEISNLCRRALHLPDEVFPLAQAPLKRVSGEEMPAPRNGSSQSPPPPVPHRTA
jgi:hypothetical protein